MHKFFVNKKNNNTRSNARDNNIFYELKFFKINYQHVYHLFKNYVFFQQVLLCILFLFSVNIIIIMYYENKNLQPPINLHTNSRKNYKKLDEGILKAR